MRNISVVYSAGRGPVVSWRGCNGLLWANIARMWTHVSTLQTSRFAKTRSANGSYASAVKRLLENEWPEILGIVIYKFSSTEKNRETHFVRKNNTLGQNGRNVELKCHGIPTYPVVSTVKNNNKLKYIYEYYWDLINFLVFVNFRRNFFPFPFNPIRY